MNKFEVQTLDSDGYIDDTMSCDTLQDAVASVARMAGGKNYASNTFKICELVEIPFVIERTDLIPSGREPVVYTSGGVKVRTV